MHLIFPVRPVDYIFTGEGLQPITFAFLYRKAIDANVLRNSLDEMLKYFPVLRSRLQRISGNDYEFQLTEDGLTFTIIESPALFEESGRIEGKTMQTF